MKRIFMLLSIITSTFAATAISAHEVSYLVTLSGATEDQPNNSPGSGSGTVTFDLEQFTMKVDVSFSGLTGNVTAAHIHCCTTVPESGTAGVATPVPSFPGFPSGVKAGSYNQTFDLTKNSSYNPAFITANGGTVSSVMSALLDGTGGGKAYFNIHTSEFGGGEIRGFLQAVPVPAAFWLMGSAMAGLAGLNRRKSSV